MAPETIMSDPPAPATPLVDMWAIGVMLYEMVSGRAFGRAAQQGRGAMRVVVPTLQHARGSDAREVRGRCSGSRRSSPTRCSCRADLSSPTKRPGESAPPVRRTQGIGGGVDLRQRGSEGKDCV